MVHQAHGGIVLGSAVKGGIRDIHARNLNFQGTQRGIRIKSSAGNGGVVEKIYLSNIVMHNISHEGITINAQYDGNHFLLAAADVEAEEADVKSTPFYHEIHIQNVTGDSKLGIQIIGPSDKHFDKIELRDVHMITKQEMVVTHADHFTKSNVTVVIDKHLYDHKP